VVLALFDADDVIDFQPTRRPPQLNLAVDAAEHEMPISRIEADVEYTLFILPAQIVVATG